MPVVQLRFNDPKRLNGWTSELVTDLLATFTRLADSPETKALIITGTGTEYFSAGANLSGGFSLQHPRTLFNTIRENNRRIFAGFLDFPKVHVGLCVWACWCASLCFLRVAWPRQYPLPFSSCPPSLPAARALY